MKTVYAACGASFAIALFFIFAWAPHPWGWEGIDQYHQLALAVAGGQPFPTMEVPWGYAYFLAAFYRAFGDRPVIPLVVQAALNSLVPFLTFVLASRWFDRRTAIVAAVLVGLFSFNTIYASTQSSDAVCTVLFMSAVALFVRAIHGSTWRLYAGAGALAGVASQFRPNLILVPVLLAAYGLWHTRSLRRAMHAGVLLAASAVVLAPWVIRNYQLTKTLLPTSVHGGVQLWYGTLQVGPYLNNRAKNPQSVFESPAFDYTSLADVPIVVNAQAWCDFEQLKRVWLVYSTDADPVERRIPPVSVASLGRYTFEIPAPHRDAVIYYSFASERSGESGGEEVLTPRAGRRAPFVYFVSQNHLGDLDVHGNLLDIFDLVRLARHAAWGEPLPFAGELRAAGVDTVQTAAAALLDPLRPADDPALGCTVHETDREVRLTLNDGSTVTIPREWRSSITDLTVSGRLASALAVSHRSLRELEEARSGPRLPAGSRCGQFSDIFVNQFFYRREPHMMRRYTALAIDNIRRVPGAFALASAYRAVRLFVVDGNTDPSAAQQFSHSRRVYAAATAVSIAVAALFVAGIVVAWRARQDIVLPLLLIAYIPATLAPVLTNMRYTVTIQPLMFMFIAAALESARRSATAGRAGVLAQHDRQRAARRVGDNAGERAEAGSDQRRRRGIGAVQHE